MKGLLIEDVSKSGLLDAKDVSEVCFLRTLRAHILCILFAKIIGTLLEPISTLHSSAKWGPTKLKAHAQVPCLCFTLTCPLLGPHQQLL